MSPPPEFALFLLGTWVLTVFAVTNQAGYDQWRAIRRTDAAEESDERWSDRSAATVDQVSDD